MNNGSTSMIDKTRDRNVETKLGLDRAFDLAESLTVIPGFPNRNAAIEAVADDLRELCVNRDLDGEYWDAERQAVWLTREARFRMLNWTGPYSLRQMYLEKFDPAKLVSSPGSESVGDPLCPKCNGVGWVQQERIVNGETMSGASFCPCRKTSSPAKGNSPSRLTPQQTKLFRK